MARAASIGCLWARRSLIISEVAFAARSVDRTISNEGETSTREGAAAFANREKAHINKPNGHLDLTL
jgi:hypothetical protein